MSLEHPQKDSAATYTCRHCDDFGTESYSKWKDHMEGKHS